MFFFSYFHFANPACAPTVSHLRHCWNVLNYTSRFVVFSQRQCKEMICSHVLCRQAGVGWDRLGKSRLYNFWTHHLQQNKTMLSINRFKNLHIINNVQSRDFLCVPKTCNYYVKKIFWQQLHIQCFLRKRKDSTRIQQI